MNEDLVSYAHGVSRIWIHVSYKTKYAHEVFDKYPEVRKRCEELLLATGQNNKIVIETVGFDTNHVHFIADLGHYSLPDFNKILKGTTGKKILKEFPHIKQRYFWGSGFWSGAKYCYSIGRDRKQMERYVAKQKFFKITLDYAQKTLTSFAS